MKKKSKTTTQTVNWRLPFPKVTVEVNGIKWAYGYDITTNQ